MGRLHSLFQRIYLINIENNYLFTYHIVHFKYNHDQNQILRTFDLPNYIKIQESEKPNNKIGSYRVSIEC